MSAWVVDDEHISVLLYAGLLEDTFGPLAWCWDNPLRREELTPETADRVGRMLLAENHRSVNYAYQTPPLSDMDWLVYTYSRPQHVNWLETEILKAIHCYQYQSCESPDWRDTEAWWFCDALEKRIIRNLPGYELGNTWGITAHSVPIATGLRLVK
jgi:hypothetical protein